jgi:hypothetical protein
MNLTVLLALAAAAAVAACGPLDVAMNSPTRVRTYKSLPKAYGDLQGLQYADAGMAYGLPTGTWQSWALLE